MLNEIILLSKNLDKKEINYIKLTIFFIIISTFFQFFSIATLVFVISVFFENNFYQNIVLINIKNFLNFKSDYTFKVFIISFSLISLTLTFFFSLINVFLISNVSNRIGSRLERVFFDHYVNCKYVNLATKSLAKILSNLKDCLPRITNYFFPSCLNFILNTTMFLIIIIALLITNFYVTLLCFFLLFFLYFFFFKFLKNKIFFFFIFFLFKNKLHIYCFFFKKRILSFKRPKWKKIKSIQYFFSNFIYLHFVLTGREPALVALPQKIKSI